MGGPPQNCPRIKGRCLSVLPGRAGGPFRPTTGVVVYGERRILALILGLKGLITLALHGPRTIKH